MKVAFPLVAAALLSGSFVTAQTTLPAAPPPRIPFAVEAGVPAQQAPAGSAGTDKSDPAAAANAGQPRLTRAEAEAMAIRDNPRISVGRLEALAQHQVYLETRSAELPNVNFAATAENGGEATRISAGSLTASRILEHVGTGANFTQLIYDFGHTHNLVLSQKLREQASNANALATTEEIVLATDQAFYNALTAQAELNVAQQTVSTRQTTQTQVNQMTQNKLKSTLDLSFANVDLSQAQLLEIDAKNNEDAAMATLDAVLGLDHEVDYQLVESETAPPPPPPSADPLVQVALRERPDLQAMNDDAQAAHKYARAEWDQLLPSVSAAGTAGIIPLRTDSYYTANWWGAIGGNVNFPIFDGFLYVSQAREAKYRENAASENSRDLRDRIVRDVHTAWLQSVNGWQRMAVTAQLVQQANLAMNLAQTRYKLGLSSIVELSQAQLQQTSAQIEDTSARYQYQLSLATLNYEMGVAP